MSQQVTIPLPHHTSPIFISNKPSFFILAPLVKIFLDNTLFFYRHQKFELFLQQTLVIVNRPFVIVE